MDTRKIAVFDSGVGGLTCLEYLKEILPNEDYLYFGDFKNNPYGTKTTEELQEILTKNIKLLEEHNVKMIVIACNTAGTQIEYLKTITNVPLCEPITVTTNTINNNRIIALSFRICGMFKREVQGTSIMCFARWS